MKTLWKVFKKLVKVYLIFDVLVLAWVGAGNIIRRCRKRPEESWRECADGVVRKSMSEWKWLIRGVKG